MISYRRVSMLSNVHLGKGACVSDSNHLYSEVPKEVNNFQRLSPQTEDQDDGSHHWAEKFLKNKNLQGN